MSIFLKFKSDLLQFGLEFFGLYYGDYQGTVVSNEDPDNRARLKVSCPAIYGNNVPDIFSLPKGMYAGLGTGFVALPQVGDPVWITCRGGDPEFPIWQYGWYPNGELPEGANKDVQVWLTPSGVRVEVDGVNGFYRVTYKDGTVFEMNDKGISLGSEDESAEKAVLGDSLQSSHKATIDQMKAMNIASSTIVVLTALGPSSVPLNAAAFIAINSVLDTIKADTDSYKSDVVTLD